jgi:hypothetical protein
MKDYLKLFLMVVVTVLTLEFINFSKVDAQGGNEEYHQKILEALKRMNVRLVRMETDKMRSFATVQESSLNQIMSIRTTMEQIQNTGEMHKSEVIASIDRKIPKLQGVDKEILQTIIKQMNAQNDRLAETNSIFKSELIPAIEAKLQEAPMQKVVSTLEEQNRKLLQTQALFKTDLIPALDTQSEEARQALLTELANARVIQKNFVEANHKQTLASLGTIVKKNKGLVEVLKKMILVDEGTRSLTETTLNNQKKITDALTDLRRKANVNISRTEDVLKKLKKQT